MILITGSEGFVGRNFLASPDLYGDVRCIDIKTGTDARDFFRNDDTHFDLVIHLAAVVGGRMLIEGSPLSLAVDLSIDAEMASWAMRTKPGHILYFSSSAAYPIKYQEEHLAHKLSEADINLDMIQNPDMTYGWAKLTGEMLMNHLRREGLSVTTLRPFSGYGSDQDLDYPFPSFIERGLARQDPFVIWGSDRTVRDWIHIHDIVSACLVMARLQVNETVNLCTGIATPFRRLAEIVGEQVGYMPEIWVESDKPKGVAYRVGNPYKMLQWYVPKISLAEGVARALDARGRR
jgi:nucleoside-diphosphate-sugar epimerase